MNFNPLTEEMLIFLERNSNEIRGIEYIINFVTHRKSAFEESVLTGTIHEYGSSTEKIQARKFIDDLEFIEQGLNGHWVDVFTWAGSQSYYRALQVRIEDIISKLK